MDKQESYIRRLYACMQEADITEYNAILNELAQLDNDVAATILMRAYLRYYRAQKGDYIASLMERALRFKQEWAQLDNVNNPLFRAALISGSKDLYDCYTEEVTGLDEEWYDNALHLAMMYNQQLLDKCEPILIGCHYNTGIVQNGRRSIDQEDYEVMDATIVRYNQIVGMRQILKDLLVKTGRQING